MLHILNSDPLSALCRCKKETLTRSTLLAYLMMRLFVLWLNQRLDRILAMSRLHQLSRPYFVILSSIIAICSNGLCWKISVLCAALLWGHVLKIAPMPSMNLWN